MTKIFCTRILEWFRHLIKKKRCTNILYICIVIVIENIFIFKNIFLHIALRPLSTIDDINIVRNNIVRQMNISKVLIDMIHLHKVLQYQVVMIVYNEIHRNHRMSDEIENDGNHVEIPFGRYQQYQYLDR
jgi:hypothetical protein